jgi:hypothetical protein
LSLQDRLNDSAEARKSGHPATCPCKGSGVIPAGQFSSGYEPCTVQPVIHKYNPCKCDDITIDPEDMLPCTCCGAKQGEPCKPPPTRIG